MKRLKGMFNRIVGLIFSGIGIFLLINLLKSNLLKGNYRYIAIGMVCILIINGIISIATGKRLIIFGRNKRSKLSSSEEAMRRAGIEGEKSVAYELSYLNKNKYEVYNSLKLRSLDKVQQFDHLVIGENGVFNLETKNLIGNIIIDEQGNWMREIAGKVEGYTNPLGQVKRHHRVLEEIIGEGYPIIDVVVLANKNTIVKGSENSPMFIIKVDSITYFIEEYKWSKKISKHEANKINKKIKAHII